MVGDDILIKAPSFSCDWKNVLFIHYEVDPVVLQDEVPFALDLFQGKAYVSCVAFTMIRVRPHWGGRFSEFLVKPLSNCSFLNIRSYVHCGQHRGIYFLREWVSKRLSAFLAPRLYRLPCRYGLIDYEIFKQDGESFQGSVCDTMSNAKFRFRVDDLSRGALQISDPQSVDEFFLERYCSLACIDSKKKIFKIDHVPWSQRQVSVNIEEDELLQQSGEWFRSGKLVKANFAPTLQDVRIWDMEDLATTGVNSKNTF